MRIGTILTTCAVLFATSAPAAAQAMRIGTILTACALVFATSAPAAAQESGGFTPLAQAGRSVAALQRPVTLQLSSATVEEAVQALARAADLGLTYDRSLVDLERQTSVDVRSVPVKEVLGEVIGRTRLELLASPAGEIVLREAVRPLTGDADQATLFGRLTNADGDAIPSAHVVLEASGGAVTYSTVSNPQGDYRFVDLPAGRYTLRVTHLGYQPAELEVTLEEDESRRLDVQVEVEAVRLEGVDVRAGREVRRERTRFETEAGVTAHVVSGRDLKLLPGLAEADVMRAVQLLPGVVSTSDASGAFNVRGGSADQNLILLDGFPIFNPFHFLGLFSVFNADVVELAELQSGGFGAEYGGRASSVLNIESRTDAEELHVDGGISMLASRLALRSKLPDALGGALGGDAGDWYISARRSYFHYFIPSDSEIPNYTLTDVQGRVSLGTLGGGRLSLIGYTGGDLVDRTGVTTASASDDEPAAALRFRWDYGNAMAGLRWTQPLGGGWLLDTRIGHSRYTDELGFTDYDDMRFTSRIEQNLAKADLTVDLSRSLSLRLGGEASGFDVENLQEIGHTAFWRWEGTGTAGAAYVAARWRPTPNWIIDPGVRLDRWRGADSTRVEVSPRFAAKRFLGAEREAAVKLSLGRFTQFIHSVRNEEIPIGSDTWILADDYAPTVVSDQIQLGYEHFWGDAWHVSVEAYLREFRGLMLQNPVQNPNDASDEYLEGEGRSYGLDLLFRKEVGRLRGWTTLSLLKVERTFPDPLAQGWDDAAPSITYPPVFDRRVNLDIVLEYPLPRGIEAGLRWNFGSGIPYTRPDGQHVEWEYDGISGRYEIPEDDEDDDWPTRTTTTDRNGARYPAYHRLDLTFRRPYERSWGMLTPYLQILNVYNRKNVLFYDFNYDKAPPTRGGLGQFPLLPALGVEVSF